WEEMTDLIGDVRDYLSNNSPKSYDLFQNESPGLGTLQMEGHSGVGKGAGENMPANDFGSPFVLPQGDGFTGRHSGGPGGDSGDVSGLSGAPISITGGGPATPPMPPSSGLLPPIVSASAVNGNENQAIPLSISVLSPTAGSTVSILLGNIPPGAVLSAGIDNGDGTWTLT